MISIIIGFQLEIFAHFTQKAQLHTLLDIEGKTRSVLRQDQRIVYFLVQPAKIE